MSFKTNHSARGEYVRISVPDCWRKPEEFHKDFVELAKHRGWEHSHPATIFDNAIQPIVKMIKRQYYFDPSPSNQWYPYYQTVVYCEEQGYFDIDRYYQAETK